MPATTIEAMAERLERLERECRRWRRAGVGLALVGAVVLTLGAVRKDEGPKTIEAERFLLKDQKGTIRGEWGFMPESGWPIFRMNNVDGERRLSMFVAHGVNVEGSPIILLHDKKGISHLTMTVSGNGKPEIWFSGEQGKSILRLPSALTDPPPPPPAPAPPPADPVGTPRTE
jgi:hypothetical protein